jgi:RNA polymerase sigma factor, sigma-70 family
MEEQRRDDLVLFENLFKQYYQLLAAKAFDVCRNWQMAEDAVQDFFAEVWLKKSWKSVTTNMAAWAVKGVQYKTISLLRKSGKQIEFQQDAAILQEIISQPETNQHRDELQRELKLIEALNALPPQRQEAFLLAHYHNKSYTEISREMGVSVNTVKTHLRLAMNQLREMLLFFAFIINF